MASETEKAPFALQIADLAALCYRRGLGSSGVLHDAAQAGRGASRRSLAGGGAPVRGLRSARLRCALC